jgi:hypothetical protein
MDPILIYWAVTGIILFIIFQDPNVPEYLRLRAAQAATHLRGAVLGWRLRTGLALSRRSLRADRLGRILREAELRRIERNPAYAEFFQDVPKVSEE